MTFANFLVHIMALVSTDIRGLWLIGAVAVVGTVVADLTYFFIRLAFK